MALQTNQLDDAVSSMRARWLADAHFPRRPGTLGERGFTLLRIVLDAGLDAADFLELAYQTVLGRPVDQLGLESRAELAAEGVLGRIQILQELYASDECSETGFAKQGYSDVFDALALIRDQTTLVEQSRFRRRSKTDQAVDANIKGLFACLIRILEKSAEDSRDEIHRQESELNRLRLRLKLLEKSRPRNADTTDQQRVEADHSLALGNVEIERFAAAQELSIVEEVERRLDSMGVAYRNTILLMDDAVPAYAALSKTGFHTSTVYAQASEHEYWRSLGVQAVAINAAVVVRQRQDPPVSFVWIDKAVASGCSDPQLHRLMDGLRRLLVSGGVLWIDLRGCRGIDRLRFQASIFQGEQGAALPVSQNLNEDSIVLSWQG